MLAADLVITELVANGSAVRDADGDTSDWIEIHNPSDQVVDLQDWSLTDDATNTTKWRFPAIQIAPGGYQVVFASGKDRSQEELHTNFKLRSAGEYLALVRADGSTVAFDYVPQYPPQQVGKSYGLVQADIPTTVGRVANVLVPTDANGGMALGLSWTDPDFDDRQWTSVATGIGFEADNTLASAIVTDLQTEMLNVSATAYVRVPFVVEEPAKVFSLGLGVKYDDGYVAYLNGVEVARANAPDELGPTSEATGERPDASALVFQNIDLADRIDLLREGPNVLAIHALNRSAGDDDFLLVPELRLRRSGDPDATAPQTFVTPTPGAPNGTLASMAAPDVLPAGGLHDEPFDVVVTAAAPGATLVVTTDGSRPSLDNGIQVAAAAAEIASTTLRIAGTTVVRVATFRDLSFASTVTNRTYVFPRDVAGQDFQATLEAGFPPTWRGAAPNYGNDPDVIGPNDLFGGEYADQFEEALRAVPTLSIVTDFDNLFGPKGIYDNPALEGFAWERPTSVELIRPDGGDGFRIDAGLRLQGENSRFGNKKSFRLAFRSQYGFKKLEYPFFGEGASDRFNTIVLRGNYNDGWGHTPDTTQYIRDEWLRRTLLDMGQVSSRGTFMHLYINGIYWGLYNTVERPDASFSSSYFDGAKDDWDGLNAGRVINGTGTAWDELLVRSKDVNTSDQQASNAAYQRLLGNNPDGTDNPDLETLLDVDNYIDYLLANFYGANTDWPHKNFFVGRRQGPESTGFKFYSWDAEKILNHGEGSTLITNVTREVAGVAKPYRELRNNDEFRLLFADHVQEHLFNGGALSVDRDNPEWDPQHPERNVPAARYDALVRLVELPLVAESARWGDTARPNFPYTLSEWTGIRDDLFSTYFPQRWSIVLEQLKNTRLYPDVDAPSFSQFGGRVGQGFQLGMAGPGDVYYTLDGSDPRRSSFDGEPGIATGARRYDSPVPLSRATRVKARTLVDGQWSALVQADFTIASGLPLRITEINYMPHAANPVAGLGEAPVDNDRFEFLELTNIGGAAVDLAGVRLVETDVGGAAQGVVFTFASQTLEPDESVVVVRERRAFESRYGSGVRIARGSDGEGGADGEYGGKLSNRGEQITLLDAGSAIIEQVRYGVDGAWPGRARGQGSSLELVEPASDIDDPAGWRASSEFGGSPGWAGKGPDDRILINEVLAQTAALDGEQIELLNLSEFPLDITNWYFSDSGDDYFRFQVRTPTVIGPGGYHTLPQSVFGFDLDGDSGGQVWLIEADANGRPQRFVATQAFGAAGSDVALGRWPDGATKSPLVPMASATFGAPNSGPAAGNVIASEIHYNPEPLPVVRADFADGRADPFTPVAGTWNVVDGRYQSVPVGKDDTISILADVVPLSAMRISATVNIPSGAEFKKNAAIIFDYRGSNDFKFVTIHTGRNRWRLGQRDENGWNFLVDVRSFPSLDTDTDFDMTVELRGQVVRVFSGGQLKIAYAFDEPLNVGLVGLGSKNGRVMFDDVVVEPIVDPRDFEFVELYNSTLDAVSLDQWRLAGAVEYQFAPETSLAPGQALVVVGFNPSIAAKADDFRTVYDLDSSAALAGPFRAALGDAGGIVSLSKPIGPPNTTKRLVLVDQIGYQDRPPWPAAADGAGKSLYRTSVDAFGTFVSSWVAGDPSPGSAAFPSAGDLNGDGRADAADVAALVLALRNADAYEATYGVPAALAGDIDGDGDLDFDDIQGLVALLAAHADRDARSGILLEPRTALSE